MELIEVQKAVEVLQGQGIALGDVTSAMVRQHVGYGNYANIAKHLRVIRGEAPGGEDGTVGPSMDDKTPDPVAQAERALAEARQRLETLETAIPEHECRVEEARQQVIQAVNLKLIAREADYRGYLPSDDPLLLTIDRQVEEAAQHLRHVRAEREDLAQAITEARAQVAACERALAQAKRDAYARAHIPELVSALESLRQADPRHTLDPMAPDYFSKHARWQAQVRQVEAEVAEALEAAGV